MSPRIAQRLGLVLFGTALGVVIGEGAMRVFLGPAPSRNVMLVPRELALPSDVPGLDKVLRPNAEVVVEGDRLRGGTAKRVTYRTNSFGFRSPPTTVAKPEDTLRIIGLGDSFTLGVGVQQEDTFLARLAPLLGGDGSRVHEVLNLGVMGYDTAQEIALLRHIGLRLSPDVVVICFFLNDANPGGPTVRHFRNRRDRDDLPLWRRASRILDFLATTTERARGVERMVESYLDGYRNDAPGWISVRKSLFEARRLSEQHDFRLAVMIFPVLWELNDGYPFLAIHKRVARFCGSQGIPVLDLLEEFLGLDGPSLWVHPNDQHPNETAHAIAAEALARFLEEQGLVGGESGSRASASER